MNSQELILSRITTAVEAVENVLLIHDREYGNTGVLRALDTVTLDQIAAVSYDFQSGYCHFGPSSNRVAALWYGQPRKETSASWVCGDIAELVNTVVNHLTTRKEQ